MFSSTETQKRHSVVNRIFGRLKKIANKVSGKIAFERLSEQMDLLQSEKRSFFIVSLTLVE